MYQTCIFMKKIIPFIVFILLVFAACEKEEFTEGHYGLSEDFTSYCYFEPGSYWVYKMPAEGLLDTIVVDSLIQYTGVNGLDEDSEKRFKYDAIEEFIQTPNLLNFRKWELAASLQSEEGKANVTNELLRLYFTSRYNIILYLGAEEGEIIDFGKNEGYYQHVGIMDQYVVNGNYFADVYHSRVYDSLHPEGIRIYDFFIARNHGIIQYKWRSTSDSVQWNLIDWELDQ